MFEFERFEHAALSQRAGSNRILLKVFSYGTAQFHNSVIVEIRNSAVRQREPARASRRS